MGLVDAVSSELDGTERTSSNVSRASPPLVDKYFEPAIVVSSWSERGCVRRSQDFARELFVGSVQHHRRRYGEGECTTGDSQRAQLTGAMARAGTTVVGALPPRVEGPRT